MERSLVNCGNSSNNNNDVVVLGNNITANDNKRGAEYETADLDINITDSFSHNHTVMGGSSEPGDNPVDIHCNNRTSRPTTETSLSEADKRLTLPTEDTTPISFKTDVYRRSSGLIQRGTEAALCVETVTGDIKRDRSSVDSEFIGCSDGDAEEVEHRQTGNAAERLLDTSFRMRLKKQMNTSVQVKVYNFLERPTGWKCFIYHFTV